MSKIVLCFVLFLSIAVGYNTARGQFLGQQSLSQSSYIIDKNGFLWAWGWNSDGQLGIGSGNDQNTPQEVTLPQGISKWTLVAGGARHALAVGDGDKLFAWGFNGDGELGIGTTANATTPKAVTNPTGVTSWTWVSAGADHSVALAGNGMLYAWGSNTNGQLGTGNKTSSNTPLMVQLPNGVQSWAAVAAGGGFTIAISSNGRLYGWGIDTINNWPFQNHIAVSPVLIDSVNFYRTGSPLASIAASATSYAVIDVNGNAASHVDTEMASYPSAFIVAVGGNHFLTDVSYAVSGGDNSSGQLGQGNTISTLYGYPMFPRSVWLTQSVAIAAGLKHSLAIGNDGNLYAWGDNTFGELGIGSNANKSAPVVVNGAFADPLRFNTSFATPTWPGKAFNLTVSMTNTGSQPLSSAQAFLFLKKPVFFSSSAPEQSFSPATVDSGKQITAEWSINADSLRDCISSPTVYAYIQAAGSSPYFANGSVKVARVWGIPVFATVLDSLTHAPLSDVLAVENSIPNYVTDTARSGMDGNLFWYMPADPADTLTLDFQQVSSENHQTGKFAFTSCGDTVHDTINLPPAAVQGLFQPASVLGIAAFDKIFFADSANGYAILGDTIFKTTNSGLGWGHIWTGPSPILHDIFFRSLLEGWVVGDSGTVMHTTDGGGSWTTMPSHGKMAYNGVCGVNNNLWVVGDSGTIHHYIDSIFHNESSPGYKENFYAVHFLDSADGICAGAKGLFAVYSYGGWNYGVVQNGFELHSVYYAAPGVFFAGGTNGNLITDLTGIDGNPSFVSKSLLYTHQTINGLYFLNAAIGFASGDSGSSFVTYDSGNTWAILPEIPGSAKCVNFWSLSGHFGVMDSVLNYAIGAGPNASIIKGRITNEDGTAGIAGDTVTIGVGNNFYAAQTNEVGNYVIVGIPPGAATVQIVNTDSTGIHSVVKRITLSNDSVFTVNADFSNPPEAVNASSISIAGLTCIPNPASDVVHVRFSLLQDSPVSIELFDALGRSWLNTSESVTSSGNHDISLDVSNLIPGTYYCRIVTPVFSQSTKLAVVR